MADAKNAAAPVAATAPSPENKPKRVRGPGSGVFPSAEAAVKEAQSRTSGHRRAFKLEFGGKTTYLVSFNHHVAGYEGFIANGGKIEEIGRAARAAKAPSVDGVLAALNALPEEDRKKVMEQLKAIGKGAK